MPAEAVWPTGVVVMGVSGCGKTTLGRLLAQSIEGEFHDADAYHSAKSISKMALGEPLTDEDRGPWLEKLRQLLHDEGARMIRPVLACSGLKRCYRDRLRGGPRPLIWIYLKGEEAVLRERLRSRAHFFNPDLLCSQLELLEEPGLDESVLAMDMTLSPSELLGACIRDLEGLKVLKG